MHQQNPKKKNIMQAQQKIQRGYLRVSNIFPAAAAVGLFWTVI